MGECQHVGRRINLGNNLHSILLGKLLQLNEFCLCITPVTGCQSGIGVTFQTESGRSLHPVIVEQLPESVVIEVKLQGVHLIIAHDFDELAQIAHRDILASDIEHESAQRVLRFINNRTAGQAQGLPLSFVKQLEQCACSP